MWPCRNSALMIPERCWLAACQLEHFVGHVHAVGLARRADPSGREQHVDATARAEVEHRFARSQVSERYWVGAADAGRQRFGREAVELALVVACCAVNLVAIRPKSPAAGQHDEAAVAAAA